MKIHHLSLATMCPYGGRLLSGEAGDGLAPAELVIHALLVETGDRLVLVDTGLGLEDIRSPMRRLSPGFVLAMRPRLREEDTAVRQIERLGFSASDVSDVVLTHLDVDHVGGIPDFPRATIHVNRAEHTAAMARMTMLEVQRYRGVHYAHGPRWQLHDPGGDRWFGFESARAIGDDVVIVPVIGHTRGHAAIAVRQPAGGASDWLLHCGDAYFFHGQMSDRPHCPVGLEAFQLAMAFDNTVRRANVARLRALRLQQDARVTMFSAHCPYELRAMMASNVGAKAAGAKVAGAKAAVA